MNASKYWEEIAEYNGLESFDKPTYLAELVAAADTNQWFYANVDGKYLVSTHIESAEWVDKYLTDGGVWRYVDARELLAAIQNDI